MHSFFVAHATGRDELDVPGVSALAATLEAALSYAGCVTHRLVRASRDERVALVAFSNEPSPGWHVGGDGRVAAISGYTPELRQLAAAEPDARLAAVLAGASGRFCAAVLDPFAGRAAVATAPVGVDALFVGHRPGLTVAGTQASAVARALGELTYDPRALLTFINTGFFGTRDTAFAGVRCVPPMSTWVAAGPDAGLHPGSLAGIGRAADPTTPGDVAAEIRRAVAYVSGPVSLGLTGGRDSRVLLAAAVEAGLDIDTYTQTSGAWCDADVYVARLVSAELGVTHRVIPSATPGGQGSPEIDPLALTATTLRATDGELWGYDAEPFAPAFDARGVMRGFGGEMLRGGYSEKHKQLDAGEARRLTRALFARHAGLFRADVEQRYTAFIDTWFATYDGVDPADLLDCVYADFRMGRWVAARARAGGIARRDWMPLADNRLAARVRSIPAAHKRTGELVRAVATDIWPRAVELPLANAYWHGTGKRGGLAIKARHPEAFIPMRQLGRATDWRRAFPEHVATHMREYCVDSGRLDLLREVIDVDAAAALLAGRRGFDDRANTKLIHGLYAACVLVSGDWLQAGANTRVADH